MSTLLLLLILLLLSSQTYVSYILFLMSMILMIFQIFLLGNSYIALIYLMIYIGSIAILFIYILMVLSIINDDRYGYLLFILPIFIFITLFGITLPTYSETFNILTLSYSIYTSLLLPIALLLFIAMIFAIRSI